MVSYLFSQKQNIYCPIRSDGSNHSLYYKVNVIVWKYFLLIYIYIFLKILLWNYKKIIFSIWLDNQIHYPATT